MKNMPLIPYEPVNMMWKPFFSDVSPAPARLLRSLWSEWALPDSPTCKWKKKISGVLGFWEWEDHKDEDAIHTHDPQEKDLNLKWIHFIVLIK